MRQVTGEIGVDQETVSYKIDVVDLTMMLN